MLYVLLAYWIVCGFAVFGLSKETEVISAPALNFFLSLVLGGIVVPAKIVQKLIS